MGKQFVRTADADRRAIELHHQLKAIEEMPLIHVPFSSDGKLVEIFNNDGGRTRCNRFLSVDAILLLDVKQAKASGGRHTSAPTQESCDHPASINAKSRIRTSSSPATTGPCLLDGRHVPPALARARENDRPKLRRGMARLTPWVNDFDGLTVLGVEHLPTG